MTTVLAESPGCAWYRPELPVAEPAADIEAGIRLRRSLFDEPWRDGLSRLMSGFRLTAGRPAGSARHLADYTAAESGVAFQAQRYLAELRQRVAAVLQKFSHRVGKARPDVARLSPSFPHASHAISLHRPRAAARGLAVLH